MDPRAAVLVGTGGFAGAVCRHAVAVSLPASFPYGTLVVNVLGSFLLGSIVYGALYRGTVDDRLRLLVSTGFVSSFTTYSTFAAETVSLSPALAAGNVAANYALGGAAVLLARGVIRWRS